MRMASSFNLATGRWNRILILLLVILFKPTLGRVVETVRPQAVIQAQSPPPTQAPIAQPSIRRRGADLATCGYVKWDSAGPVSEVTCQGASSCVFSTRTNPSTTAYQGCCGAGGVFGCDFPAGCINFNGNVNGPGFITCPSSAPFCQYFTYPEVDATGFGCDSTENSATKTVFVPSQKNVELRARQDSLSTTQFQITNEACSTVAYALDYCNSFSPGFSTMYPTNQAPCLCYNSGSWVPNWFDGAVETCAEYLYTADPSDTSLYSSLVNLEGFCSSVGTVLVGSTTQANTGAVTASSAPGGPTGGEAPPPSSEASPTSSPTGSNPKGDSPQDMTPGQIAGTSVGCAAAAGLGIYALYLCCFKPKPQEPSDDTLAEGINEKDAQISTQDAENAENAIENENQLAGSVEIQQPPSHHILVPLR